MSRRRPQGQSEVFMKKNRAVAFVTLSRTERDEFRTYLRSVKENGKGLIIMSYPAENEAAFDFAEFFETPYRYNRFSHDYEGTYAVDLSDYIRESSSPELGKLRKYTDENEGISFVLFAVEDCPSSVTALRREIERIYEHSRRGIEFYSFRNGKMSAMRKKNEKNGTRFGY